MRSSTRHSALRSHDPTAVDERPRTARSRWIAASAAGSVAVVAVAAAIGGHALASRHHSAPSSAAGPGGATTQIDAVTPWLDLPPAGQASVAVSRCDPADLTFSLGSAGAWHGQATQAFDATNRSTSACSLVPAEITAALPDLAAATGVAGVSDGVLTLAPDALDSSPLTVPAGGAAHLSIGAPASCSGSGPAKAAIAKQLDLQVPGGKLAALTGAWIPLSCGAPAFVHTTYVDGPSSADAALLDGIEAQLAVPAHAQAGATLDFTVTLTNANDQAYDLLSGGACPTYSISLKSAQLAERYQLNCDSVPGASRITPGASQSYAMRIDVPASASGEDLLTWEIGSQVASTTTITIG